MNERPDVPIDRLLRSVEAPDLTGRIMGRLGYMRSAPAVSRRRRGGRVARRLGLLLVAGCAIAVALHARQGSDLVRRAEPMSVPAAIDQDAARIRRLIRPLGRFTVPVRGIPRTDGETGGSDTGIAPGEVIDVENLSPFPMI